VVPKTLFMHTDLPIVALGAENHQHQTDGRQRRPVQIGRYSGTNAVHHTRGGLPAGIDADIELGGAGPPGKQGVGMQQLGVDTPPASPAILMTTR
jgi:hypothetical protein